MVAGDGNRARRRHLFAIVSSPDDTEAAPRRLVTRPVARPRVWDQGFCVSPATAATRMAPKSQPNMPMMENKALCQPLSLLRSGSLKKSVNSLLISITGRRRLRVAPKHQP